LTFTIYGIAFLCVKTVEYFQQLRSDRVVVSDKLARFSLGAQSM